MKKNILPLLFVSLIVLQSCLNSKYETTPAVMVDPVILVNDTDTVTYLYNNDLSQYCTDTLLVGDTVMFTIIYDALGNNLTKAQIKYQPEYAYFSAVLSSQLEDVVTQTESDGGFVLDVATGYRAIVFQFKYVPLKAGLAKLEFRVESDSQYSPVEASILTPIALKSEEEDKGGESEE
ncbi:MAG: hypothetical protein IJ776_03345 [Paludibacteraceae bacterium]|nr:hypothetical protein [Paludibacteraceae bacterium]